MRYQGAELVSWCKRQYTETLVRLMVELEVALRVEESEADLEALVVVEMEIDSRGLVDLGGDVAWEKVCRELDLDVTPGA